MGVFPPETQFNGDGSVLRLGAGREYARFLEDYAALYACEESR